MDLPYRHLNIPFSVRDEWKNNINDFNSALNIYDENCELLTDETKQFLSGLGLDIVNVANYWSWDAKSHNFYHVDGDDRYVDPHAALNFLLQGSPGITKWIDISKCKAMNLHRDHNKGTYSKMLYGLSDPDHYTSIIPGKVMLTRVDLPHSVDRKNQTQVRWSYRFMLKRNNNFISWQESLEIFNSYIDKSSMVCS